MPSSFLALFVLCASTLFAVLYGLWLAASGLSAQPWFIVALVAGKASIEVIASVYALTFACAAVLYFLPDANAARSNRRRSKSPRIAVIYLCCGDVDRAALRSLATLRHHGELTLLVHDDSETPDDRAAVDAAVRAVADESGRPVVVLRRSERTGGKPGALNFVLDRIVDAADWFVLCDNDSIALDPDAIDKALRRAEDPSIGIVQFRTVGVSRAGDSPVNRRLAQSVDAFHLFLKVWSRFGWMPFIGHNALLRTSAVHRVGGFTPGFFADDVDLTVRLNVAEYSVVYAPEIRMGETHPTSYAALRRRSYKWAYGCMQVLKVHARRVLTSPRFTIAQKFGFFQFAGFYVGQTLVLGYLFLALVVSPLLLRGTDIPLVPGLLLGSGMVVGVFLPVLAYFAGERRAFRSLGTVLLFGLAYGATDFVCIRGMWDCVRNRLRTWVPTNVATGRTGQAAMFGEALFGAVLLAVPLCYCPTLLWFPCAYLFAGKFLFAPAIDQWYDSDWRWQPRNRRRFAAATTTACVVMLVTVLAPAPGRGAAPNQAVEIRGKDLYVDGRAFVVKGVHYGPWRPGTGPNKQYPYPDRATVDADLTLLAKLHANAIVVVDPPDYVLDVAQSHGLHVFYTFTINWWRLPLDSRVREQLARVRGLRNKPAS